MNFNYKVRRRHHARRFHEVSGFDSTIARRHREGGEKPRPSARPDKHSNIVLKWGITTTSSLPGTERRNGDVQRRNG